MAQTTPGLPGPLIDHVINAPNPFDSRKGGMEGQTRIGYTLLGDARVQVTIYDLVGIRVRDWTFHEGSQGGQQGSNQFVWDGTNETGQKVSKGGYLAVIQIKSTLGTAKTIRKIGVIH